MAQIMVQVLVPILLVLVAGAGATPPGIAKGPQPGHASCQIKKYKHCYNLVHVCPKFCPDECTVECASCKPICVGGTTPSTPQNPLPTPSTPQNPPPSSSTPSPSTPTSTPSTPKSPPPSSSTPSPSSPTPSTPQNPPPSSSTPSPSPSTPTPSTPENPPPSSSTPSPSTPSPSTPHNSPPSSSSPPSNSTPNNPLPPSSSPSPSVPSPSTPSPITPSPSTPSPTPSGSGQSSSPKTARCWDKNYPSCYNTEHVCPNACPGGCEVDCNTCKPVCKCDKPGAVCQDPRFIGGDGITFYFHGRKDNNFCLVSDPNLHINAHFIGRRNHNMKRDFTWVQSIAILFDNHQLFLGAHKTTTWEDSIDRLALSFDGEPITLHEADGAMWQSSNGVSIVRVGATNNIIVKLEGRLRITAKVVPITEEDSRIHSYGITKEDCFAHLDLGFKFFSLSNEVSGVLGQTYNPNYVSRVNIGAKMPIMGGGKEYETTNLFSPDCSVARFIGNNESNNDIAVVEGLNLPYLELHQ